MTDIFLSVEGLAALRDECIRLLTIRDTGGRAVVKSCRLRFGDSSAETPTPLIESQPFVYGDTVFDETEAKQ